MANPTCHVGRPQIMQSSLQPSTRGHGVLLTSHAESTQPHVQAIYCEHLATCSSLHPHHAKFQLHRRENLTGGTIFVGEMLKQSNLEELSCTRRILTYRDIALFGGNVETVPLFWLHRPSPIKRPTSQALIKKKQFVLYCASSVFQGNFGSVNSILSGSSF